MKEYKPTSKTNTIIYMTANHYQINSISKIKTDTQSLETAVYA